jgi:hypothetical protein
VAAGRSSRRVKLPSTFQLGAHTFRVRVVAEDVLHAQAGAPCYASFFPDSQEIWIEKPRKGLSDSLRKQSFFHELGHALLWTANSRDYDNEKVVDALGHALLQFMNTKDR